MICSNCGRPIERNYNVVNALYNVVNALGNCPEWVHSDVPWSDRFSPRLDADKKLCCYSAADKSRPITKHVPCATP